MQNYLDGHNYFSLNKYVGVEMLDHVVDLILPVKDPSLLRLLSR